MAIHHAEVRERDVNRIDRIVTPRFARQVASVCAVYAISFAALAPLRWSLMGSFNREAAFSILFRAMHRHLVFDGDAASPIIALSLLALLLGPAALILFGVPEARDRPHEPSTRARPGGLGFGLLVCAIVAEFSLDNPLLKMTLGMGHYSTWSVLLQNCIFIAAEMIVLRASIIDSLVRDNTRQGAR